MNIFNYVFQESTDERRVQNSLDSVYKKGKKGKERKSWENKNSIWQGKRR